MNIKNFITLQNSKKKLFTPGPGSLLEENISGLSPCFGRGDDHYQKIEKFVLNRLKKMTGHRNLVRLQGSASLALEISIQNFIYGKVLVVNTGVYSQRLISMIKNSKVARQLKIINWKNITEVEENFDWIVSCSTETSMGLKIPITDLFKIKKKCKSKLMLDATASIGLEDNHDLADLIAYSSCKGLFGLTGASFIAYNQTPNNKVNSFYMSIESHHNKLMTGPYHSIQSLYNVLKNHNKFKYSVKINKEKFLKIFKNLTVYNEKNQPLICTYVKKKLVSKNKKIIFYKTRSKLEGSVLCHLGETYLKKKSKGDILKYIKI